MFSGPFLSRFASLSLSLFRSAVFSSLHCRFLSILSSLLSGFLSFSFPFLVLLLFLFSYPFLFSVCLFFTSQLYPADTMAMDPAAKFQLSRTPSSSSSPSLPDIGDNPYAPLRPSSPLPSSPSFGMPPPSAFSSPSPQNFAGSTSAPPPPKFSPQSFPSKHAMGGAGIDFYGKEGPRGRDRFDIDADSFPPRMEVKGPSIVGDLRTNLDDIKSSLVGYYSRLYSQPSTSIEARLDALSSKSSCRFFDSSQRWLDTRRREKRYEAFIKATMSPLPDEPSFLHNHTRGRSSRSVGLVEHNGDNGDDLEDGEDFYSYPGGRDSSLPPYSPGYPSSSQRRAKGEVYDMLRDLRLKCETASTRLTTLADGLYPHVTNPNLREWEYSTIPKARRQPSFESAELRRHVLGVYKNLHSQAEINQSRINALQSKMKILQMQTHADMIKLQQDPRVAF
ncbi:hypothetical protein CSUI_007386 [Cystoisospora suis]|uniref:Transmembrane protein n=1 Tax=Cystoisospora suis TaxID=483139 RepID=A0A2C6KR65_9APIC|nr:hypothetical protein CSUI_007386 [Cystoisospora suis]